MSITNANTQQNSDLQALCDMLKARYGGETAQEITKTIKATLNQGKTPDYMLVKALSEMVEQFFGEAVVLRAELRLLRAKWVDAPENITVIKLRCMETDFRQIRRVWWISLKLYQSMYREALSAAQISSYPTTKYGKTKPGETALAA